MAITILVSDLLHFFSQQEAFNFCNGSSIRERNICCVFFRETRCAKQSGSQPLWLMAFFCTRSRLKLLRFGSRATRECYLFASHLS